MKILVIYDSGYGATEFAARVVAETLLENDFKVDLCRNGQVDPAGYDGVFVGSPVRLGRCTPKTKRFVKKNRAVLALKPAAFFFTCMSVTNNESEEGIPLFIDPLFSAADKPRPRFGFMENNHTASYYLKHFFRLAPGVKPAGTAFFKGRLDTSKLSFIHRLIMALAMYSLPEIKNGNFLNPGVIKAWAEDVIAGMDVDRP